MTRAKVKKDMRKLENQYTWEELANLFADRIESSGFIGKGKYVRWKFIDWFNSREKVGLLFDWRLVARCYMIWMSLQKNKDHFTVIVGDEGDGKTTLAIQMSSWIAPNMDLKDVVFNMPHYIEKLQEVTKDYKRNKVDKNDKSIVIDEGGISLFSRESMSASNRILAKTFMVQRYLNIHVCICIPHYWSLDTLIRNHRIKTLIVIKKRANYECIVGKGIKILNKLGAKDKEKNLYAIPIPYGFFWEGKFRKGFPKTINVKQYDKHKFKHIKSFLDDAKLEAESEKMINVKQLEKEFGIEQKEIVKDIQRGEIEGRRIGNKWFITKKAYKKLIME